VFQHARLRSGDGPFYSEKDAAVGKTDCTTMLKLVPFVAHTSAPNKPEFDAWVWATEAAKLSWTTC